MNWGYKVAIGYGAFVVLTLAMVFMAFQHDVNLITPDYYAQEYLYQENLIKRQNLDKLNDPVVMRISPNKSLSLQLPVGSIGSDTKGKVEFFRPSDRALDFSLEFEGSEGLDLLYNLSSAAKGYWKLKITWNGNGQEFYFEEGITL